MLLIREKKSKYRRVNFREIFSTKNVKSECHWVREAAKKEEEKTLRKDHCFAASLRKGTKLEDYSEGKKCSRTTQIKWEMFTSTRNLHKQGGGAEGTHLSCEEKNDQHSDNKKIIFEPRFKDENTPPPLNILIQGTASTKRVSDAWNQYPPHNVPPMISASCQATGLKIPHIRHI